MLQKRRNGHLRRTLTLESLETRMCPSGVVTAIQDIFTGAVIASNFEPRFAQPAVFGYAIFLFVLWATTAIGTGAGLDTVAYVDKAIEALLVVNMALLIRNSRGQSTLS